MKQLIRKYIPEFLINSYHFFWSLLGAFIYRFPSRRIKVIGVTGTNGKSTVVFLIEKILEKAGYKVASVSSIKFKIGKREWLNFLKMTMPGRMQLQKFLFQSAKAGCHYAIIEVTSEGIKQYRHKFINFDVAILTNLTPEHIESHGSFERYQQAKGNLFKSLKSKGVIIVNLDDPSAEYFLSFNAREKIGFTLKSEIGLEKTDKLGKIIRAENCQISASGVSFNINQINFSLPLLGEFNIYNALAAICAAFSQGIDLNICQQALNNIVVPPGRLEKVISQPFKVFVDYAHTPDALKKVYSVLKPNYNSLICVLGACGGGRDRWKRPEMGRIASHYCRKIILTNEDPYDENPEAILEDIEKGIKSVDYEKIIDRRKAIRRALNLARKGEAVIITGKGCEPWMCISKGRKIPWDDRKVVKEEIKPLILQEKIK